MFTVTKALEEALLQHFIYTKLDIAYAINKPFPFFEALRDNSFITERMYQESLEACQNLVPLSKVVHKVLTSLEQTFHTSLLLTLFSQVNLHEYPSMVAIFRSFRNVATAYEGKNRTTQTLVEIPAEPAEGRSPMALPPPPPLQPSPPSHLCSATRACEPRAPSQQPTEILKEQPSLSRPAVPVPGFVQEGKNTPVSSRDHQRKDKEDSQEKPHSPSGPVSVIKDNLISKRNKEARSGASPPGSPGIVDVGRDDSPAPNDLEMPPEAPRPPTNKKAKKRKRGISSNSKRRQQKKRSSQGVASPGHGVQEKLKVVCQRTLRKNDSTGSLKMVTRSQKARTGCAQTSRSQELNNEASKANGRKKPQRRCSIPPRTTGGKSRDDTVDFLSPTLPVTCGEANGIFFKEKRKQGASEKCIQNEAGAWFTPKEFLIEGKKAKSKDWKKAILCQGKTLRSLEQKGLFL